MVFNKDELFRLGRDFLGKATYLLGNRYSGLWEEVQSPSSVESAFNSAVGLRGASCQYAKARGAASACSQREGDTGLLMSLALLPLVGKLVVPGKLFVEPDPRFAAEMVCCLLQFEGFKPTISQITKVELIDILSSEFDEIIVDALEGIGDNTKLRLEKDFEAFVCSCYEYKPSRGGDAIVFENAKCYMELQGNDVFKALGLSQI